MTTDCKPSTVALALLSFFAAALFAGNADSFWNGRMDVLTPAPSPLLMHAFIPPARKAILVDRFGEAQRTADNIRLTRRDRSRDVFLLPPGVRREGINVYVHGLESSRFDVSERAFRPELPPRTLSPSREAAPAAAAGEVSLPGAGDRFRTPEDRRATYLIRRSILSEDALFITALNVRIETADGRVHLSGFVNSQKEKEAIGSKAAAVAGAGNVDNQLQVLVRD
ncbi:MAG TPA: BON domain-containing protein [Candidatus Eisenbacteria bacterium]|jgi:hypothetical protein|nr:BON domain-containing protein [Candidatus Eisenbacteria bacterium]